MAATVTHAKVSGQADGADPTQVQPSDWNAAHVISGLNLQYVGTATVAGSAATTFTLSGLNLTADQCYIVFFMLDNATASAVSLSLYYSGDSNPTSYEISGFTVNNGTITGTRANSSVVDALPASDTNTGFFLIQADADGRPRTQWWGNRDAAATIQSRWTCMQWIAGGNVTDITLSSSVASAFAIGSSFKVFKVSS